jgi:hypothetical protein
MVFGGQAVGLQGAINFLLSSMGRGSRLEEIVCTKCTFQGCLNEDQRRTAAKRAMCLESAGIIKREIDGLTER